MNTALYAATVSEGSIRASARRRPCMAETPTSSVGLSRQIQGQQAARMEQSQAWGRA